MLRDAPKIALTGLLAVAVFGLWFVLDPQRQFILNDFVLRENVGKFDAEESGYLATALWGKHSIWQYTAGWLTNAGLVAPLVIAVFVLAWRNRRAMPPLEQLLWIWVVALFVFHLFPNLRYERYLLPAMPAVAVLCGLYWNRVPRWVLVITAVAALVASVGLLGGAVLLAQNLPDIPTYSATDWLLLAIVCAVCAAALFRSDWTRPLVLPSVLLVYFGYTVFLRPFDSSVGAFPPEAVAAAAGRDVVLPAPFTARDEIYRFLLPGADIRRIKDKDLDSAMADGNNRMFIVSTSLDGPQELPDFETLGRRLNLRDYFRGEEMTDMLRGNVAKHLFAWDLLVERANSAAP